MAINLFIFEKSHEEHAVNMILHGSNTLYYLTVMITAYYTDLQSCQYQIFIPYFDTAIIMYL